jgi:hypothetical protein
MLTLYSMYCIVCQIKSSVFNYILSNHHISGCHLELYDCTVYCLLARCQGFGMKRFWARLPGPVIIRLSFNKGKTLIKTMTDYWFLCLILLDLRSSWFLLFCRRGIVLLNEIWDTINIDLEFLTITSVKTNLRVSEQKLITFWFDGYTAYTGSTNYPIRFWHFSFFTVLNGRWSGALNSPVIS